MLRAAVLKRIRARGGWAFPTTGVAIVGIPDVVGSFRGVAVALELKTRTGRVSPKQQHELDRAARAGAAAHVIRSVQELDELLDRIELETPS